MAKLEPTQLKEALKHSFSHIDWLLYLYLGKEEYVEYSQTKEEYAEYGEFVLDADGTKIYTYSCSVYNGAWHINRNRKHIDAFKYVVGTQAQSELLKSLSEDVEVCWEDTEFLCCATEMQTAFDKLLYIAIDQKINSIKTKTKSNSTP